MSEIKVDKISPQSGTALQIGDASDVITIPASATITNLGTATGFGGGKIVQVVNLQDATTGSGTNVTPSDDTIPQLSETNIFLTGNFTPTSATNKLLIFANLNVVFNFSDSWTIIALFNDDTHATNALAVNYISHHSTFRQQLFMQHYMTSGFATEMTFKVGAASHGSGTTYYNAHTDGTRKYGGAMYSEMTIMEIEV